MMSLFLWHLIVGFGHMLSSKTFFCIYEFMSVLVICENDPYIIRFWKKPVLKQDFCQHPVMS